MVDRLASFEDRHRRTLYDLSDGPRPDQETPAPARLLGAFDSTLLAYAPERWERIIPQGMQDVVYQNGNLQIRASFLPDGLVAGTWTTEVEIGRAWRRREATLTLRPVGTLPKAAVTELAAEGEGLLAALHPTARAHRVATE